MNIKLIALDMDGTTLDAYHNLTPANRDAIAAAQQQNIEVVISTGRSNTEMLPLWEQFPKIRYFSCGNGSKIYDRQADKNIFEDMLPFSHAVAIVDILQNYDVLPEIYADDHIYAEASSYENLPRYVKPEFEHLVRATRTPFKNLPDFLQQWQKPIEKINVFFQDLQCRDNILARCTPMDIALTNALGMNLEMNSPTASKGNALHHLCTKLGITAAEVMAIGDGCNDISMLEYAGCSIAMENAVSAAKAAAKFTTGTNIASGVAASIRRYALS